MRNLGAVLAVSALIACSPIVRDYGYAPSNTELAEIVVGVDTRDRVQELVGAPAASSLMRENAWYYLAHRQETYGYKAPVTTDRQLVAISFSPEGTVTNIERFTLSDGRVIVLNRRVTEANTQGISFIRQLLSNLGRINTDEILGGGQGN